MHTMQECCLCPRCCGVNRLKGEIGFCGETADIRIALIEAHFGEEPPISGQGGSGTIFFSGCTLQCDFCQNVQISHQHVGTIMSIEAVVNRLEALVHSSGIHNVNFVTPDHFFPATIEIVSLLRRRNVTLPAVYNLSGYQSLNALRQVEEYVDIYLPDFKYSDATLGAEQSHCCDYPAVALEAVLEMIRQKGFLDTFTSDNEMEIAWRGVLVRHLILPGYVKNSIDALSMLFLECGRDLPLSLMSQYHPVPGCSHPNLQRRITQEEFQQVYAHALSLGFRHLFVQYPEASEQDAPQFLPDFRQSRPFRGNIRG